MPVRTDLSNISRDAQNLARASVREVDDKHLMQQVKKADVHHGETPTDFERWQMVGMTFVPLKQEKTKQQTSKKSNSEQGDWDHDQPQGKSAEALMLYLGSHSHPVGIVDDRRVRPYGMKEGEGCAYDPSGNGQMCLFNAKGTYLVSVNNPPEQSEDSKDVERFASLRHVNKKKQSREIKENEEVKEHPHEGETVNMEVRATKNRIEFRAGDQVVGYYEGGKWCFIGEIKLGSEDADHPVYGKNKGVGKTSENSGAGAVLIKAPKPGPPVSEDTAP
jgi:phage gp45-like